MSAKRITFVVCVFLLSAAAASGAMAATLLKVHWVESTSVQADFNGDGRSDQFVTRTIGDQVAIAVALAGTTAPQVLMFPKSEMECSPALLDKSCGIPRPKLEVLHLTTDTFDEMKREFEFGFDKCVRPERQVRSGLGAVDETDPYLVFWNAETRKLGWARL